MVLCSSIAAGPTTSPSTHPSAEPGAVRDTGLQPVPEDPSLPRVLIIGDSISMGYMPPLRAMLKGKANVQHPKENCGPTTTGLKNLNDWLATGSPKDLPQKKWDIIHFNFGLHDLKLMKGSGEDAVRQVPPEKYEKNLRELVRRLKLTGAKLIWASTTPVPENARLDPPRLAGDVIQYNQIAEQVMKDNDIPTDDLYALILPIESDTQVKSNVHFTPKGYHVLAAQVAESIEKAIDPQ